MNMLRPLPTILSLALCLGAPAFAQPDGLSAARLLPGWVTGTGAHMAALHIELAPGWKTYWRSPGETGIPPKIDLAGSGNLGEARLHWPTPELIEGAGLRSIGYERVLVLPIELSPRQPGAPIALRANVEIGICRDICVPVSLSLSAELPTAAGTGRAPEAGVIAAALADRPQDAAEAGLGAVRCSVEPISDGLRLHADISPPPGAEAAAIELPDPSVWVSQATLARHGDLLRASADLVPTPGQTLTLDREALTITLFGATGAVEIRGCASGG